VTHFSEAPSARFQFMEAALRGGGWKAQHLHSNRNAHARLFAELQRSGRHTSKLPAAEHVHHRQLASRKLTLVRHLRCHLTQRSRLFLANLIEARVHRLGARSHRTGPESSVAPVQRLRVRVFRLDLRRRPPLDPLVVTLDVRRLSAVRRWPRRESLSGSLGGCLGLGRQRRHRLGLVISVRGASRQNWPWRRRCRCACLARLSRG
jgi:hypothetical protein